MSIKKAIDNGKSMTYKIKFINSLGFMPISNLVDNLSGGLDCDKCIDCKSCLNYMSVKDYLLIFKCFECKNLQIYMNFVMKTLINLFLLLKKCVYLYEYMNN